MPSVLRSEGYFSAVTTHDRFRDAYLKLKDYSYSWLSTIIFLKAVDVRSLGDG